jgi:hypothetical protein
MRVKPGRRALTCDPEIYVKEGSVDRFQSSLGSFGKLEGVRLTGTLGGERRRSLKTEGFYLGKLREKD